MRAIVIAMVLSAGCASAPVRMSLDPAVPSCRGAAGSNPASISWVSPFEAGDRGDLLAWCEPVGPAVHYAPQLTAESASRPLAVVSWNMAVGAGSVDDLVRYVRGSQPELADAHLILLLQEAYRHLDAPAICAANAGVAAPLGRPRRSTDTEILEVSRRLAMHAVYVPSMRNGTDCAEEPREDRGNAILSTLPLADLVAIELPFAQQRRVAIAATIRYGSRALKVVSVHFDTVAGHRSQAEGVWRTLETLQWMDAVVVGGDFNARPVLDSGIREMRSRFAEADCGGRPTHENGFRLDRLFFRELPEALLCQTGAERFGSDHHPLIGRFPNGF